jgi:hypothetical protein
MTDTNDERQESTQGFLLEETANIHELVAEISARIERFDPSGETVKEDAALLIAQLETAAQLLEFAAAALDISELSKRSLLNLTESFQDATIDTIREIHAAKRQDLNERISELEQQVLDRDNTISQLNGELESLRGSKPAADPPTDLSL